jgi:hypothetical protein
VFGTEVVFLVQTNGTLVLEKGCEVQSTVGKWSWSGPQAAHSTLAALALFVWALGRALFLC